MDLVYFGILMSTKRYWIHKRIATKYQTGFFSHGFENRPMPSRRARNVCSPNQSPPFYWWNHNCFNPSRLTTLQTIYQIFLKMQPLVFSSSINLIYTGSNPVETTTRRQFFQFGNHLESTIFLTWWRYSSSSWARDET